MPRFQRSLRAFVAKLGGFLSGMQQDADFDQELREHLLLLTDKFIAQGMSPEEAVRAARRQFGNIALVKEDRRGLQTLTAVEAFWLDLRYALRALAMDAVQKANSGHPGTLALGIGAATAIFSVIDNVLLSPFPYKGAERIVFPRIHGAQDSEDDGRQGYTASEVLEFAETNHVFDGTSAAEDNMFLYKHGEGTEQLEGARVTPGTFEFFGMPALHGRLLQPMDYEPNAPPVFVMRYKTWKERFNGDLSLLNTMFVLNGTSRTLVGIMPPRFGWYDVELYLPEKLTRGAGLGPRDTPNWFFVGRLKPGVSRTQAEADMTVIAKRLAAVFPKEYPAQFDLQLKSLGESVLGRFRQTLYIVLAAVGLLLLIACSNVANLMLARATTREKEFAMRAALGARRARLIRLLMLESLMLAVAGAALGIFLAWGGLKVMTAAMPQELIPAETVIQLNAPVLIGTLCLAVLTAMIFGLAPALQSSRADINDSLRDSGKGVSGSFRGRWMRDAVVIGEVALSLTLLIGAGLLMRSFLALRELSLGLRADHVFQAAVVLPEERYSTPEQVSGFFRPLFLRLKALPGVVDAAEASALPPYNFYETKVEISGKTSPQDWQTSLQRVSEEYFRTLRIQLRQGRTFNDAEENDARRVAVVNETFVRKYLPGENPIGQHVRLLSLGGTVDPWFELIGVVADVTNRGLQAPVEPELWIPSTIPGPARQILIVRTAQDPAAIIEVLRKQVWATDSGAALALSSTLEDRVGRVLYAGPRFGFVMMSVFGCVGLILVIVGVYSVLAYATARKTHEIGILMALGAKPADVLGQVIKTGLRLVVLGSAIGIGISLILGRLIGAELVGVRAYDPATLMATTVLMTLTAVLACWIPARRAARVDPVIALRCP